MVFNFLQKYFKNRKAQKKDYPTQSRLLLGFVEE